MECISIDSFDSLKPYIHFLDVKIVSGDHEKSKESLKSVFG